MIIEYEDGWYKVAHDHMSAWWPKEQWIRDTIGPYGITWQNFNSVFDKCDLVVPLKWGFKNKSAALMFILRWHDATIQ